MRTYGSRSAVVAAMCGLLASGFPLTELVAGGRQAPTAPWPTMGADVRNSGVGAACHAGGRRAWSTVLPSAPFRSLAVGADETVYAVCESGTVYALNGKTGERIWHTELDAFPAGAPAVGDTGMLFVACRDIVHALDLADGKEQWKQSKYGDWNGPVGLGAAGTVYVDNSTPGNLVALDGQTGRQKWIAEGLRVIGGATAANGARVCLAAADRIYGLRASSGERLWSRSLTNRVPVSPAIAHDSSVYLFDGMPDAIHLLSLTSRGELRWTTALDGEFRYGVGPSIGPDGTVYVAVGSPVAGRVDAFEPQFGKRVWSQALHGMPEGPPAISADDKLFVTISDGSLSAFDAGTGHSLWTFRALSACVTGPAIGADNRVYFATRDGAIHAIE